VGHLGTTSAKRVSANGDLATDRDPKRRRSEPKLYPDPAMKAIVQERYGPPEEVLHLRDVDTPVPADDEVLVRVRATSVHPDVWHMVHGRPYILRLGGGMFGPRNPTPGTDVAGVVESVGRP
jgi:D-arabinose 1-dehydrogenase-like Zn-dependent alcohol dehydrogenase